MSNQNFSFDENDVIYMPDDLPNKNSSIEPVGKTRFGCITTIVMACLIGVVSILFLAYYFKQDMLAYLHYNSGRTSYLAGDLELAIHEFDQAIELKPDYADAYFGRGLAHLSKLEYNLSIIDLSQAISIKPAFVEAYYYRGTIYANQTSYDKAIADLTQAIQLDREFTDAYFSRGGVYLDIENYESAVTDFSEVIEQEPSNAVAYNNRCWSYFKQGKYELALPDCERSLVLEQDNINTLDSRARVYLALGDTEKAIADFERIIELNPNSYLAKQAERALTQIKGVTTNLDDNQTSLMPANVEFSQLEGEWTGIHTLTGEGSCSLGVSNSATSPVSMWWTVNHNGAVEIKIEEWPGFPYTFVGQVQSDMSVSLELSTEAMCSGKMVPYTANFSGVVRQEGNTLKLEIEAVEVWCPPDCVFRRQYSIEKTIGHPPTAVHLPNSGNLALKQQAKSSKSETSRPSKYAVDGNTSTDWGSGDFSPQWIEIDLGAPATITKVRLLATQYPNGDTTHRILVRGVDGDFLEVHQFKQYTRSGEWLVFIPNKPLENVQIIRIETLKSPSWVGWVEIEVVGER